MRTLLTETFHVGRIGGEIAGTTVERTAQMAHQIVGGHEAAAALCIEMIFQCFANQGRFGTPLRSLRRIQLGRELIRNFEGDRRDR